jgi:sulfide:quinone oxidoreductase
MSEQQLQVVVCGGGIAGAEGLLRLHRLAAERIRLTLVAPDEELVNRPLAVREPFALPGLRRYPLARLAADTEADWVQDRVAWLDRERHTVHTGGGTEISYDALLLAVGARESAPFEHAHMFSSRGGDEQLHGIVQDLEMGYVTSVAFVLPEGRVWPLPLYELALMTAERARSMNMEPRLYFSTPEAKPLEAFGGAAGEAVAGLLERAGVTLYTGVVARVPEPQTVELDGLRLEAQRIITLPKITGPAIRGIPAGADWFVPIDERCVVRETNERVFAAGDATDFPVKHGGIGAQQADTAAAGIAHLAGIGEVPPPLHPVIRGKLLTGEGPLYLTAHVIAGRGWESEISEQPPWPADEKVVAEELGPYLAGLDAETA